MPWTWPLLLHPVRYLEEMRDGESSVVVALGNPVLWWGFLLLLPVAVMQIVRRATWQDAVVFGGYAAMFLPVVPDREDAVHLVHAAGGPVHVPGGRGDVPSGAGEARAERSDRVRRPRGRSSVVLFMPVWTGMGRAELVDPRARLAARLADL